jgi:hypothetical protein
MVGERGDEGENIGDGCAGDGLAKVCEKER